MKLLIHQSSLYQSRISLTQNLLLASCKSPKRPKGKSETLPSELLSFSHLRQSTLQFGSFAMLRNKSRSSSRFPSFLERSNLLAEWHVTFHHHAFVDLFRGITGHTPRRSRHVRPTLEARMQVAHHRVGLLSPCVRSPQNAYTSENVDQNDRHHLSLQAKYTSETCRPGAFPPALVEPHAAIKTVRTMISCNVWKKVVPTRMSLLQSLDVLPTTKRLGYRATF